MKEVSLRIPDDRIDFFMELVNQLGFEVSQEIEIPEEDKATVRERIQKSKRDPDRLLSWEKVQDDFRSNQ